MAIMTEEDIRVRAYHLWEADGRPFGRDLEFWARAQQSLANGINQTARPGRKAAQRNPRSQPAAVAGGATKGRRTAPRRNGAS